MLTLTESDQALIETLRRDGVLEDVDPHRINGDGRNIVIMCSDGHQASDQIATHAGFVRQGEECCCHSHMLNGGALLLSPKFTPRSRHPAREVLLAQIRQSLALKGANTAALYVHAPCGAARLRNLAFNDVLDRLFEAKATVKQRFLRRRKFKVACFVQIDYGKRKQRSYFVSHKKWEAWKRQDAIRMAN